MSFMDLTVVGYGLVSPVALTPREHVFFIRAEAAMSATRAFVDSAGEPLDVMHCAAVDPTLPPGERARQLVDLALDDALSTVPEPLRATAVVAYLCSAEPSDAFGADDATACEEAWGARHGLTFRQRFVGAASIFAALSVAAQALDAGAGAVAIVAVDSFAHPAAIAAHLRSPSRWESVPPRLSEAAAVIIVARDVANAACSFGQIRYGATAPGAASDLDDEPVDGRAMTALVRHALSAAPLPIGSSFGPHAVDALRRSSWEHAWLRNRHGFSLDGDQRCVEHAMGRVGAAAGAAHLVYALASRHHGVIAQHASSAVWAVSRDGTCGLGVVTP